MFNSYDFSDFSLYLKHLRTNKKLSRDDLADATGLNRDTLRKIENGTNAPSYVTLSILSNFYKLDLCEKFSNFKSSRPLHIFYNRANTLISLHQYEALQKLYNEFKQEVEFIDDFQLVYGMQMQQIELFMKSLSLRYTQKLSELEDAESSLIQAIKLSNPNFTYEDVHIYNYSEFELRILLVLANIKGDMRDLNISNKLALFITNTHFSSIYNSFSEQLLIIKCYSLLSYNHHRNDCHNKALYYAQEGINLCLKCNTLDSLDFLLIRKGIAMYYLEEDNYKQFIVQAINLMVIRGEDRAVDNIKASLHNAHGIII